MDEFDKKKLFDEAFKKDGIQAPDLAYYTLVFAPLFTGIVGLGFWGYATLFRPSIPEDRLSPLLYTSIVLIGGPVVGDQISRR